MSQPHDFPFDITDVAELLHLRIRRPSPQGLYVDCPICNDKRGKMHINTQTDTWRCNYCDESGGMLTEEEYFRDLHADAFSDRRHRHLCAELEKSHSDDQHDRSGKEHNNAAKLHRNQENTEHQNNSGDWKNGGE